MVHSLIMEGTLDGKPPMCKDAPCDAVQMTHIAFRTQYWSFTNMGITTRLSASVVPQLMMKAVFTGNPESSKDRQLEYRGSAVQPCAKPWGSLRHYHCTRTTLFR